LPEENCFWGAGGRKSWCGSEETKVEVRDNYQQQKERRTEISDTPSMTRGREATILKKGVQTAVNTEARGRPSSDLKGGPCPTAQAIVPDYSWYEGEGKKSVAVDETEGEAKS